MRVGEASKSAAGARAIADGAAAAASAIAATIAAAMGDSGDA